MEKVLKADGVLIIVLPNKDSNFDHRRSVTTFQHILDDANNNTLEDDLTHLDEILSLHDLAKDPPAGDAQQFKTRSLDNFQNRTLHHHVFDAALIRTMLEYAGFNIVDVAATQSDFFALAKKAAERRADAGFDPMANSA